MTSDKGEGEDSTGKTKPDAIETLEDEQQPQGPLTRLAARFTRPPDSSREAKSSERTRGLVILAGTTLVCIFLFFGLFTTDSSTTRKERRTTPSLGRPETAAVDPETANRSPVPQLSVNQQPNEETGELSEQDLLGTMRNRGAAAIIEAPPEGSRRQDLAPPPQPTRIAAWNEPITQFHPTQSAMAAPAPAVNPSDALRKSSIVFVRASAGTGSAPPVPRPSVERKPSGLLPQGTALVARLQHSVSSAAKVPVTAVIEYNYEEDGQLVVPAGTKAYGELTQATPQGWVGMKFHTLEFPNGDQEAIHASALSMDRGVLRGDVNGKNSARKFLTRTLTGIGTIAAFAVGGRGLSGGVDNSILLRERLASNIALAGEQELAMLAYQQNIVVTVPANTRFYLVLHEAGVSRPGASVESAAPQIALSEQELREMVQLRNELREMNRMMQLSAPKPDVPD